MAKCLMMLLSFAFFLSAAGTATPCHRDDLRALRGFAENLGGGGALSLRTAWSGASCCGWEGVCCDSASGRVTALWLPGAASRGPSRRGFVSLTTYATWIFQISRSQPCHTTTEQLYIFTCPSQTLQFSWST